MSCQSPSSTVRHLIDQFGRRDILLAARGEFGGRIPTHLRADCEQAGQYLDRLRREQRIFEDKIVEP